MLRALRINRRAQQAVRSKSSSSSSWRAPQKVHIVDTRWSPLPVVPALSVLRHLDFICHISTKPAPAGDLQSALARTETVNDVLDVWEAHRDSVYTHNVVRSCLYYGLKAAKSQQLTSAQLFELPRFELFWRTLVDEVPSMSANTAIKCLYNCAQFDFKHKSLALSLIDVCTQKSKSIPSVSIGILLWSLKRLDLISSNSARPLVVHVIDLFYAKLCAGERFKPQTLCNILWVLASTVKLPMHISARVVEVLPHYLHEFDFHSLSLCLWSLTTSGATLPAQLLDTAGCVAAGFLEGQKSVPNTVHCCWAFASAEYYHEQFCKALSQLILREPRNSLLFTPRLLSSVAWMCAKVSYYDPVLLDRVASLALNKVEHFNAQDLGNLMYAYAQLNHPHQQLVKVMTAQIVSDHILLSDDHACVSVTWANIAIGEYPLPLLEHMMASQRVRRLITSKDQNSLNFLLRLQTLLRAECSELNLSLPHEMDVFVSALLQSRWAHPHTKFLHSIVNALLKITGSHAYFTVEALTTALYSIDIEMILDADNNPLPIPEHWHSWESVHCLLNSPAFTETNHELVSLLKRDEPMSKKGFEQPLNLASDWAGLVGGPVKSVGNRVAIEVDGPWHYAANCRHTLGKTLFKHCILRCMGWRVISIPYFEWQQLKSEKAQVEYLRTNIYNKTAR